MIRAMACIFVVLTHSITNFLNTVEVDLSAEDRYIIWIRFAILCATPIFILLSEALISKNYSNGLPKGFFKKRFKYILIPYLFMGVVVSYRDANNDFDAFLSFLVEKIIIGNWYGFFIIVIFQFYFLHWLIGKELARMKPLFPLILSFVITYLHIYSFENIEKYNDFILTYYPLSERTNILFWLFYFVVAFYTGQYYERIITFLKNKVWLIFAITVISYLIVMNNVFNNDYTDVTSERYDMMIYAVSVFFLMLVLFRKYQVNNKTLMMLSHFSFFIYLSHMLILPYFAPLALRYGDNFFIYLTIISFFTIATSIGWATLFYKGKFTRLFTGKIRYLENK